MLCGSKQKQTVIDDDNKLKIDGTRTYPRPRPLPRVVGFLNGTKLTSFSSAPGAPGVGAGVADAIRGMRYFGTNFI